MTTQAPEAFKRYNQFILWRQADKLPVDHRTLTVASAHDPGAWTSYEQAAATAALTGLGIGFVFTAADPFWFLDIDGAWDGRAWSTLATSLCQTFAGCAVEVSQSGTGLHVFGSGPLPAHGCRAESLELYSAGRYVALTGTGLTGSADHDPGPEVLRWLVETHFAPNETVTETTDWTTGPCSEWVGPADDQELLARMLSARSAANLFGSKASVKALWDGAAEELAEAWPSVSGTYPFDHSSADAALCAHLAFWTGRDCERMLRMFSTSALGQREKWQEREDYRRRTILNACARCKDVYGSRQQQAPQLTGGAAVPDSGECRTGYQLRTITEQLEVFKGCVYVRGSGRIFVPDGEMLKPEQFNAWYGGYLYSMDSMGTKTTPDAWKAFTKSQAYTFPRAVAACFRPEHPPGAIIIEEGEKWVNTYVPAVITRTPGDPSPILNHLVRMVPDERDRAILLAYMAACVQYPGKKFQWCPLVQGVEGNGKTLLSECVAGSVGWKYTHTPNASDLANKFNAWLLGKLFCTVEEVCVADKQEIMEHLKPLITNHKIEIQGKGDNQKVGDNRANFMMFSNHKAALRKTANDRRYAVIYTAQQNRLDLRRDGMGGTYFPNLYRWLREQGGQAIMAHFLSTYPIPDEFNPARDCHRAPTTTSTHEALTLSLGGLEQDILEAVEEGKYGFAGGWISSLEFGKMLVNRRDEKRIPPHKRNQILLDLGYMLHPGIPDGRVNNIIPREGGKPKLYIRTDHPTQVLTGSAVLQAYLKTQRG